MKVLRVLDRKIRFTNGIAFGPDNHLYANASFTGEIYRYEVLGEAAPKRVVFGNVLQLDANPDFKGPDGMAFGMATGKCVVAALARYGIIGPWVLDGGGTPIGVQKGLL